MNSRRVNLLLFGSFAALAIVLGSIGIYGLIAFFASLRTHEIGIRIALGATRRDVLWLIIQQGLALTAIGIVMGLGGALALNKIMAGLMFHVPTTDPLTYIAVAFLWAAVAAMACYMPARRATRVDPISALRCQ